MAPATAAPILTRLLFFPFIRYSKRVLLNQIDGNDILKNGIFNKRKKKW